MMEVTILQRNRSELTIECVKSLRAQLYCDISLTIVDQGSLSAHREAIRPLADRFIDNGENRPIYTVWNELISSSECEYVGIVNNDAYLADTCICRFEETLTLNPKVAWVHGVCQSGTPGWAHCTIEWPDEVRAGWKANPALLNDWARSLTPSVRFWNQTDTCVLLIRQDVFREVGAFDVERLGVHHQDWDYGQRVQKYGYVLATRSDAVYWHWCYQTLQDGAWGHMIVPDYDANIRSMYPGLNIHEPKELFLEP